jgi:uroporphyrinogen decarboxylase
MDALSSSARFLDACRFRPVDRPPVWMMRQAGRYLPEYREVRLKVSFWELCRSVDLASEVSLQPFRRFDPDGVIFFSDILVPVAAMGARVEFSDGGPTLPDPVRDAAAVERLARFDPASEIAFTGEILSRLKKEVAGRAAVLGFCGAPWTLASYLVEGGASKSFAAIKTLMGREPGVLRRLLDLLADVAADVLSFQIASGADAVQLFDTWAGELALEDYREWALPSVARAISGIRRRPDTPVLLYVNGCAHLVESLEETGADVLSIDWRLSLAEARRRAPGRALQGNLDPGLLLGEPADVARRTRAMLEETGGEGHVVNLGHGVLPGSRLECVEAFFDAARQPVAVGAASSNAPGGARARDSV